MSARFEIVRTDAGWHSRFVAANGRIVWVTESYTKRYTAVRAIVSLVHTLSPTGQVWASTTQAGRELSSEVRYGSEGHSTYLNAHRIDVRDVDERTQERAS